MMIVSLVCVRVLSAKVKVELSRVSVELAKVSAESANVSVESANVRLLSVKVSPVRTVPVKLPEGILDGNLTTNA